jgi:hypothetical protein
LTHDRIPPGINPDLPSPARVYDYLLGGKDNYAVDRVAAERVLAIAPQSRDLAIHNRGFLGRAVRFLAGEAGIGQFLDIGTGLPTQDNVHQVARRIVPDARVVYADNDPMVRAHAHALLCDDSRIAFINADARDPCAILGARATRNLVDFGEPVAVLMLALLHFLDDAADPAGIVARISGALAPGSYVAISHVTSEGLAEEVRERIDATYAKAPAPLVLRTRAEIEALFGELDLIEPGLVDVTRWRPDREVPPGPLRLLGGIARVG